LLVGNSLFARRVKHIHINYLYLIEFSEQQCAGKSDYAILDFGCGSGEAVIAGRHRGLNIFGADIFYEGGTARQTIENSGLVGTVIRKIKNGTLDFPDSFFDVVFTNQVIEHIEDLDAVLTELCRVLKPGGVTLHLFASRDIWREGHSGIPFLHWFDKGSKLRYLYAFGLRRLGFGRDKGARSPEQWTKNKLFELDNYCFYRDRSTIKETFARHFTVELIEDDYISLRLGISGLRMISPIVRFFPFKQVAKELFRKLGGLVLLATKLVPRVASDETR
jgi:SAM-dependent methyltransferase